MPWRWPAGLEGRGATRGRSRGRRRSEREEADPMRAVVFEEHGGPEVLRSTEVPDPSAGPGEVVIAVRATSANFNDIWARRGEPKSMRYVLPHISGSDAAGVVAAVGEGVSTVSPGDEVLVHPGRSCRVCDACTGGEEFFCRRFQIWGF